MNCCEIWEVFGETDNLIKEYDFWKLLVRNRNTTLGNCVLITKRHIEKFSDINEAEMIELTKIIKETENALKKAFNYDKINWQMLMMKDKHLHFHVLPRYENIKEFAGIEWSDDKWPTMTGEKKEPVTKEILNQVKDEIIKNIL